MIIESVEFKMASLAGKSLFWLVQKMKEKYEVFSQMCQNTSVPNIFMINHTPYYPINFEIYNPEPRPL